MWLLLLCGSLTLWAWNFQQLVDPSPSRYFYSVDSYTFTDNRLSTSKYTTSYAFTAWINFHGLPTSDTDILDVVTMPGYSALFCKFSTTGSIKMNVELTSVSYVITRTGITLHTWVHVGIGLNYDLRQAWVSLISWAGVQVVQTQALDFYFSVPTPAMLSIKVGGFTGPATDLEWADTRYYASPLTVADMLAISGWGTCEVEDLGLVTKLTMEYCLYTKIYTRYTITTLNAGAFTYTFPYTRLDTSYSTTMWMWFTEVTPVPYRAIFRLTRNAGNSGVLGDRVMAVFLYGATDPHRFEFFSDNPTTINQSGTLNLPVRTM